MPTEKTNVESTEEVKEVVATEEPKVSKKPSKKKAAPKAEVQSAPASDPVKVEPVKVVKVARVSNRRRS